MDDPVKQQVWLVRPYEGTKWRLTHEPPTEELRRWLEYRPVEAPPVTYPPLAR